MTARLVVGRPRLVVLGIVLVLLAVVAGTAALPLSTVPALPDAFGGGELLAWGLVALATGGLVFGPRDRRPPVLASGLLGSAALLGAGPVECAVVAAAGAIGGLRRLPGLAVLRVAMAGAAGWVLPGVLAVAATAGGPVLGRGHEIQLGEVLALWLLLAVGVPVAEALGTRLLHRPAEQVDVAHMLRRRMEPQTVLAALAVVAALSYATLGPVAALVVLLPAAATRLGFSLHADGRRAVEQTLAAMTVLPEWVGIIDVGHTARVRAVVEEAAVELGLPSRLRRDVVRAAELHELGHLDRGAERGDRGRVARSGAAVLEQAGMRSRVVDAVRHTDPTHPGSAEDVAARLVVAACELDAGGRRARDVTVQRVVARVAAPAG